MFVVLDDPKMFPLPSALKTPVKEVSLNPAKTGLDVTFISCAADKVKAPPLPNVIDPPPVKPVPDKMVIVLLPRANELELDPKISDHAGGKFTPFVSNICPLEPGASAFQPLLLLYKILPIEPVLKACTSESLHGFKLLVQFAFIVASLSRFS